MKTLNIIVSVIFAASIFLFITTVSIGLPIYFRPFYYLQIKTLGLEQESGYTYEEIKDAYDSVLDYLVFGEQFSTGVFPHSDEGKAHFEDCKILFNLNLAVLTVSAAVMCAVIFLSRIKVICLCSFKSHKPWFYSGVTGILLIAVVALAASINFDKAFVIFHSIFFPGKDNWIFNSATDPIIDVLPQVFFMNCAILIACALASGFIICIVADILSKRKHGKTAEK